MSWLYVYNESCEVQGNLNLQLWVAFFFFPQQSNTSYLILWKGREVGFGKNKSGTSLWKETLVSDFAGI